MSIFDVHLTKVMFHLELYNRNFQIMLHALTILHIFFVLSQERKSLHFL